MKKNEMFLTEKTKRFFKLLKSGITKIDNVEFLKSGEAVTVLFDGKTVDINFISEGKDLINRLINRHYDKQEGSKVDSISSKIEDELSYLETILKELIKKRAKVSSRHYDVKDTRVLRIGIDSLKNDLNYTDTMLSNEESLVVEEACAVLNIIRSAYNYFDYYKIVVERKNNLAIEQFNYDIEKLDAKAAIKVKKN